VNVDKRVEMLTEIRRLRSIGQPEVAADLQEALDSDEFRLTAKTVKKLKVDTVKPPSKAAKKEAWIAYAKNVSNIDHEVIEATIRDDLIGMLKANGIDT